MEKEKRVQVKKNDNQKRCYHNETSKRTTEIAVKVLKRKNPQKNKKVDEISKFLYFFLLPLDKNRPPSLSIQSPLLPLRLSFRLSLPPNFLQLFRNKIEKITETETAVAVAAVVRYAKKNQNYPVESEEIYVCNKEQKKQIKKKGLKMRSQAQFNEEASKKKCIKK